MNSMNSDSKKKFVQFHVSEIPETWQVVDIYASLRPTATLRVDIADPTIANSGAAIS